MNELRICVCNLLPDTKIWRRSHAASKLSRELPGVGREEWEDRPGELARRLCREGKEMCQSVCSLPRRGSSRVPAPRRRKGLRDAPKVRVGGYTVWARAKLSPSVFFELLVAVSVSVTAVVVWAPHYHYNVVRTKARKTRPKKNEGKGREIWVGTNAQTPGSLSCETVDCKTVVFFFFSKPL